MLLTKLPINTPFCEIPYKPKSGKTKNLLKLNKVVHCCILNEKRPPLQKFRIHFTCIHFREQNSLCLFFSWNNYLTYFKPMFSFYNPGKSQNNSSFLMFQGVQKVTNSMKCVGYGVLLIVGGGEGAVELPVLCSIMKN